MGAIEWGIDYLLGKLLIFAERALSNTDEFLNYDVVSLLNCYSEQHGRFHEKIPYMQEACFIGDTWQETVQQSESLSVKCLDSWFTLAQPDAETSQWQQAAYDRMVECGKVKGEDTTVVRLFRFDAMTQTLELQRTKYSQQAKSNLVLDWNGSTVEKSFSFGSLRSKLVAKHGRQFPPLNEDLLANTVGIAAMLLFRADSGEYLPYLQKRADGLAVFPGAFHCTASGATQPPLIKAWDGAEFSFGDVFLSDMYRELYEEIGVARSHILDLVPVALCREYLRGGKPQIFFVGLTDLSPPELKKARIEAIRRKGKSDIKEIESRAFVPRSSKELNDFLQDPKITLETLPALHYADRYATVRLAAN